jgi:hypothetical protein
MKTASADVAVDVADQEIGPPIDPIATPKPSRIPHGFRGRNIVSPPLARRYMANIENVNGANFRAGGSQGLESMIQARDGSAHP